ncbi:xanthine dehydrogenase family protein molybdopterin-binding subunit [Catalinimonas niigatensis]|uniref:xanthine dehydrogenase family protein molybdopterin-binding subunit n=1 Tax=Catalinimonas niigatensis TaxID=1397264 RepID=UPI0026662DCB|nr:molybdopterin cofactor-binding domain-containing protein [Catalinimonas niigatensis]WPP51161.1 molybdopterin cofactor-binding domain-containing protein [Catalinimonas niigatensis]
MTLIKTKFNRRSFLKVSSAAGGGMLLGFNWMVSAKPMTSPMDHVPLEWFDINAFIRISDTGTVTIMSPNPEIGQNVKTAMPMIVAEELDVDWKNVVVEQAPLDTSKYAHQIAGGSQSIRQGWQGLRMAGAAARRMLMETAAQQWKVPFSELTTEKGIISHKKSGKSIGYGEVATKASSIQVPEELELKDPKDFKLIGKATKNVDGRKIVTGKPLFGLDYKREGMLIAMIAHPPAFGMKIKDFDATRAKSMPGIKDVFKVQTAPSEKQWSDVNAFPELVAIVGESTWQVMKAKRALKVNWEVVSPAESSEDHNIALEQAIATAPGEPSRKDGDPEMAFKNAAKVIEKTYDAPFLPHNTMEPMNFFAHVTNDKAELMGPIQTPENLRKSASSLLGLPEDKISVGMTRMGGGFGRRLYGNFGLEAAAISKKAQAPIKLVYSREDDMSQGTYRPAYKIKYRAALDDNNVMTAFHVRGVGIHEGPAFANRYPAGTVPHYLAENKGVESNISTGAWRAPRSNFVAGAEQSFLDEVAEAAGKDPIDFRLELFDKAINNPVGKENDYDPARYAGVLKLVREKSGWDKEMPGVYRGVSAYFCHNSYVAQVVDVVMNDGKPKVKKVWCAVDCGIVVNPEGAINQVEGGIVDGIGHAMYGTITFKDGVADQSNFNNYHLIRSKEAPVEVETFFVENGIDPTGLGEPSLPPIIGALANALYKATGTRLYRQPFSQEPAVVG